MKADVKIEGLNGILETLKKLPPEVVSKRGGPVLKALNRAARIIRNQARQNFKRNGATPGKTGVNWSTGFTEKYIINKRAKMFASGPKGERVVITVKSVPHPSGGKFGRSKRPIKTNDVAFIMEYGSAKQPAEPWLRPAFDAKKEEAMVVMKSHLLKEIDKVTKRLAQQHKGIR